MPVRMPAALLDTGRPTQSAMRDWLMKQLRQIYQLSEAAARELVDAGMVLPVLDGLDETDAEEHPGYTSRAAQIIRACNTYLTGVDKAAVVLTCRISQYEALEQASEWVHDAARVQLRPVGLPAARGFLTRRVTDEDRWQAVLDAMRRGGNRPLARALSTPWRLTLAAIVYDQRDPVTGGYLHDPAELTSARLDSEDKIRDHLLGMLIPAVTTVHGHHYSTHRVHH